MKKLLATIAAVALSAQLAIASSIAPVTGPQDPSQLNATINGLINSIATGVNGMIGNLSGTITSTATTAEQTLASITVPANTLAGNGQAIRVRCSGVFANTTHTATSVKVYFGTSNFTTGSATTSGQAYDIDLVVQYTSSPTSAVFIGRGVQGSTTITASAGTNPVDNMLASNLVAKCTATQGTASAGDVVANVFYLEQMK